jgi:hypothetical protein
LDTRHAKTRMAIADRGNRQIRLYDLDGTHARTFGADLFHSPNMTVPFGDLLLVPELVAGLTILDKSDRPLTRLGFHANANQLEGWPDNRRWIQTGLFNSPHSAAVDTQGNIYIVEWITGGRVTKLQRL